MKKLVFVLLLIGIIIPVNAQSFLDFSSGQQVNNLSTNPVKTITAIENGKNVRIEFPEAKLVSDITNGIYVVNLISGSIVCDAKQLVINH